MQAPILERVVVFLDYANVNSAAQSAGTQLDYEALLQYVVAERFLVEAFCYFPVDPRNLTLRQREIDTLWMAGYVVNTKVGKIAGDTYKCDFDVEIALDVVHTIHMIRPDTIVLMSGDVDFVPIVEYARKRGIRVEGAAFFDSTARDFAMKCSGFIELDQWANSEISTQETEDDEDADNQR